MIRNKLEFTRTTTSAQLEIFIFVPSDFLEILGDLSSGPGWTRPHICVKVSEPFDHMMKAFLIQRLQWMLAGCMAMKEHTATLPDSHHRTRTCSK
jgi:hypothetical protein